MLLFKKLSDQNPSIKRLLNSPPISKWRFQWIFWHRTTTSSISLFQLHLENGFTTLSSESVMPIQDH